MFWQGGAKKRMLQMIQTRLQPIREHTDPSNLMMARKDDDLLNLYYHRNELSTKMNIIKTNESFAQDRFNICEFVSNSNHSGDNPQNQMIVQKQQKKKPQKQIQIRSKRLTECITRGDILRQIHKQPQSKRCRSSRRKQSNDQKIKVSNVMGKNSRKSIKQISNIVEYHDEA